MVWPFSRGRSKRLSGVGQTPIVETEQPLEKPFGPTNPLNATPRTAPRSAEESSLRKRRRSPEHGSEKRTFTHDDVGAERRRHRSRASVENITALPGSRRMETSPHLRRSDTYRTAIPYKSSPSSASRLAAMTSQEQLKSQRDTQKRRLSKRQEYQTRAIREEEIRAMSAPVSIPKRDSVHGDLLLRENKKARRAFTGNKASDDKASTVSIPFQESIHSSMSAGSESRGWEIPKLNLFSPRPTVRLASSLGHGGTATAGVLHGLSRSGSKKDKLPALQEGVKSRDRRRMAELADDLDASDLRLLMERDSRRKEKKDIADKDKLDAKLRRRASKSRTKEKEPPVPPIPTHPAFRQNSSFEASGNHDGTPPTPGSDSEKRDRVSPATAQPIDPIVLDHEGPSRDSSPSPFADLSKNAYHLGTRREDTPQSVAQTTMETPFEDPISGTAEERRFSHGRLSHISSSPPHSPIRQTHSRGVSPLRREFTPDLPSHSVSSPLRHSESLATRKPGTWASIFRRSTASPPPPRAGTSFSNTSRDSMSKQPIPAHLISTAPRRFSGTPARTQSIFREDLPESPSSLPDSRVNSPDIIAAANVAAARRSRRAGSALANDYSQDFIPDSPARGRSKSPMDTEGRHSALGMSASLASIDSEGSWLTGRPSKRKSTQSYMRNSIGSVSKRRQSDAPSYDDLGIPDDEIIRRLTPSPEDEVKEAEAEGVMPITKEVSDESIPLRRNTSRRKPNLVLRDETAKSREGLVAEISGPDGITNDTSSGSLTGPSTLDSDSEYDQVQDRFEQPGVVYGRGHARQLSSGSAKLLEIPSRTRSGPATPDLRLSVSSNPETLARSSTGLQSPPLSPAPARE